MKLYAVFTGGHHPRANTEVHDLRFVVGESLEATVPALRAGWWGKPSSLHIDGYAELTEIDGWQVELVPGRATSPPARRLWFVNLGGYTPGLFGEQHNYLFLAGDDKAEVWTRARALSPEWTGRHKDNFVSIDEVIDINGLLDADGWHIRLDRPATGAAPARIVSDYIKL
ncbi:conserved hypothetical protein [Hyphomonas neptunium ATCC 15444]|uniref:DUF1543 domain-containing protein n=2 Tax=Hyphomonas TaxID=85 RepID=Q0C3Q6_HYPNA|nr:MULTISPECIES: DUF1543 domain-containing protein [Hyphomonas]ABI77040.1 conserved hypothetical protein [Hyphomonas neptunium ATCC 15444]KCZ96152.1 hypothetical protein HHI_00695 [Hyphomonas hirschiana VP5]